MTILALNKKFAITALAFAGLLTGTGALASDRLQEENVSEPVEKSISQIIQPKNSWAVAFDNDILVPGKRDQDYTYGVNLTYSGERAKGHWLSLHSPLGWANDKLGIGGSSLNQISHKIEYGMLGFTPEDIQQADADPNDRPYASLLYVSSSTEHYNPERETSWTSTLTVGALGLDVVGQLQETIHDWTDGDQPLGWDHQISEGGELTARYSLSRQELLFKSDSGAELKSTWQASVGYITETSWSLGGRLGKIHTPWVSFNPELTTYGEKSAPAAGTKVFEHYLWAGVSLKGRLYNAFLQGQFRDSDVEYDSSDLNQGIVEAWLGYTMALTNGYRFTYSLRGHTSEIKEGNGDRNVLWGGVQLAKTFG